MPARRRWGTGYVGPVEPRTLALLERKRTPAQVQNRKGLG